MPGIVLGGGRTPAFRDFGIVEALPTANLSPGVCCTFKAAAGVYWRLQYTNEDTTYPWNFIGGLPTRLLSAGNFEFTSATYVAVTGMEIKPPLKGVYVVQHGIYATLNSGASSNFNATIFNAGVEDAGLLATHVSIDTFEGASIVSPPKLVTCAKEAALTQRVKGFTNTLAWVVAQKWITLEPQKVG